MTKAEFLKQLKRLSTDHQERFGYPFLPISVVRQGLGLSPEELSKHLLKCRGVEIMMNPLSETVQAQLPSGLETLTLAGETFVSLALKPS